MQSIQFLFEKFTPNSLLYLEVASYEDYIWHVFMLRCFQRVFLKGMYQYMIYAPYTHNKKIYIYIKI